ncbi:MAG: hypothetical protein WBF17_00265 [Phycisphaerae bacterium]
MTQNPYSQPPSPQPPYPQAQAYYPPPKRSVWPTVIGIISIILAALGLICTPLMTIMNTFNPASQQVYEYLPDWYRTWEVVSAFGGIIWGVLLLIAGIGLLKRRPVARTLHLVYAVSSMVVAVINGFVLVSVLSDTGGMPAPVRVGMIGGAVGGTCGALIYPVFLLIWFLRASIAAEVRSWAAE